MKKISLLLIIFISVFSASAQSSKNGNELLQSKNQQIPASAYISDLFIDNITVYPNPVTDVLRIAFRSSHKSIAGISLFNNIGKSVYNFEYEVETGSNVVTIDFRSKVIEPGIYFIQCVAENDIFTRKLIVK